MQMKGIIAVVGFAVAASGASANDEVENFGNVGGMPGGDYFASGFVTHEPGSFTDYLKFKLESASFTEWLGLGTIADQPKVDGSNIEGLTAQLFTDTDPNGNSGAGDFLVELGSGDYISNSGPLTTGDYFFKVTGAASGPSPSAYAYTASVSPVPEPGSYAMMLAGLGLMGLIATRRNSRQG